MSPAVAPVGPPDVWGAWSSDPLVLAGLVAAGACYARGLVRIWGQVGRGRVVRPRQALAWAAAWIVLLVALVSPLDALAHTLMSAHMVQHVLLIIVAAPLLAAGTPTLPLLQGLPHRTRRPFARLHARATAARRWTRGGRWVVAVVGAHAVTVWIWHLPGAYDLALRSAPVHALEHATLLGTALLVWWTVLESARRSAMSYGAGIAVVFLTGLGHGGLGAVLSFAPAAMYPVYAEGAAVWGLSLLHDQNLAGTLMWVPSKLVTGAVVACLVVAWLREVDHRVSLTERAR